MRRRKCWRLSCDVGEVASQLILQPFRRFTHVTTCSPTLPSLYPRHNSFSNPSVALTTSQLILQHFRRFTHVTAHSPTLPFLHLRHSSFSNPSSVSLLNSLGEPPMSIRRLRVLFGVYSLSNFPVGIFAILLIALAAGAGLAANLSRNLSLVARKDFSFHMLHVCIMYVIETSHRTLYINF